MIQLLLRAGLPTNDLRGKNQQFLGIREGGTLIAVGGLECHGSYGLMRSLVVADKYRGLGKAKTIVKLLINNAHKSGLKELYLLTTSAEGFFTKIGFERIGRDAVPLEISQTTEFSELCPKTAIVMRYLMADGNKKGIPTLKEFT
jgi:amino-acid N-acetyltransferase